MSATNICNPQQYLPVCSLANCTGLAQISITVPITRKEDDICNDIFFTTKDSHNEQLKMELFSSRENPAHKQVFHISWVVLDFVDFLRAKHNIFKNIDSIIINFEEEVSINLLEERQDEEIITPLTMHLLSEYKTSMFDNFKIEATRKDEDYYIMPQAKKYAFMYAIVEALDCEHPTPKDELDQRIDFAYEHTKSADNSYSQMVFLGTLLALNGSWNGVEHLYHMYYSPY